MKEPEQQQDGSWSWGGISFSTRDAASAFAKSRTEKPAVNPDARQIEPQKVVSFLVSLALFGGLLAMCSGDKTSMSSDASALYKCQQLLKSSSRDASTASVPFAPDSNNGKGSEFYFAWSNSSNPVNMRNGFGLAVNAGASCIVDRATLTIKSASLDGRQIL